MSLAFIDCEFPPDPEEKVDADGQKHWGCKFFVRCFAAKCSCILVSVHHWSWQYTRLLHGVISTSFGAKTPPYSTVLDLDKKIRDFPVPVRLRVKCGQVEEEQPSAALQMQRFLAMATKETSMYGLPLQKFKC